MSVRAVRGATQLETDTRTAYGDRVVMNDAWAFTMIIGFFACVATGADAMASGEN